MAMDLMVMQNPPFSPSETGPALQGTKSGGPENQDQVSENTETDFSGIFQTIIACFTPSANHFSQTAISDGDGPKAGDGRSAFVLNISAVDQTTGDPAGLMPESEASPRQRNSAPEVNPLGNRGHGRMIDTAAIFSSAQSESTEEIFPELQDAEFFKEAQRTPNSGVQSSDTIEIKHIDRDVRPFARVHAEYVQENKLPGKIAYAVKDGIPEMEIELDPPSLGRLKMQIATDDNRLSVKIVVDTAQTKEILDGGVRRLEMDLIDSGFEIDTLDISLSQNGSDPQNETPEEGVAVDIPKAGSGALDLSSEPPLLSGAYLDPAFRFGRIDFFA